MDIRCCIPSCILPLGSCPRHDMYYFKNPTLCSEVILVAQSVGPPHLHGEALQENA